MEQSITNPRNERLHIKWEKVGEGRYDVFGAAGKPLYLWADEEKLTEIQDAVFRGDDGYFNSLSKPKSDGGVMDSARRSCEGDFRPLHEALKKMDELKHK